MLSVCSSLDLHFQNHMHGRWKLPFSQEGMAVSTSGRTFREEATKQSFLRNLFFSPQQVAFCWSLALERKTKQNTCIQGRCMSTYLRLSQPSSALQAVSQVNVCLWKSSRPWAYRAVLVLQSLLYIGLATGWAPPLRPFMAASFPFSSLKVPCKRTVLMISPALCSPGSSHLPLGGFMYAKPSEGLKGHDKSEGNLGRYRISGLGKFVPGLNNIKMFLHAKKGIYLNILGGFFF